MGSSQTEYWVGRNFGGICITERNPCRCCPNTYTKEWVPVGKARPVSGWFGYMKRRDFLKWMDQHGWEQLPTPTEKPESGE